MASELTPFVANALLNWFRGTPMPAAPATVYVSLWAGKPSTAGSTEHTNDVRGNGTGRVAVPWSAVANRTISNTAIVDFGISPGAAEVTWSGLHDAPTGGNLLAESELDTGRAIKVGDPVAFPIGDVALNFL